MCFKYSSGIYWLWPYVILHRSQVNSIKTTDHCILQYLHTCTWDSKSWNTEKATKKLFNPILEELMKVLWSIMKYRVIIQINGHLNEKLCVSHWIALLKFSVSCLFDLIDDLRNQRQMFLLRYEGNVVLRILAIND